MTEAHPAKRTQGPLGWRNWQAHDAGESQNGAFEFELYTDAAIADDTTTGPYQWVNTYAGGGQAVVGHATPLVTLHAELHLTDQELTSVDFDRPTTKDYLAGDLGDEMASLASLALARRLKSGGLSRRFDQGDARGVPFKPWQQVPRLGAPPRGRKPILPWIANEARLADVQPLLDTYPKLTLNNARAIARAARLYAQALWIADDDPAQAWLRFVSAIEAAAAQWKAPKGSALDRLREGAPELADLVEKAGEVSGQLAEKLAPTVKATAKFLEFILTYLPAPPERRPQFGLVDWDDMRAVLTMIYDHRSRDLHAGTPFPGPMCEAPMPDTEGFPLEKIHSLGVAGQGAVWSEEELPMHLHLFAYVAGGALRNWWTSLA